MKNTLVPALAGFCVLTGDGALGYRDARGEFIADADLSRIFGNYNRKLLAAYLERPTEAGMRLGIVYQPPERRLWGSETLALETAVLKQLYGVCGRWSEGLTEFQRRNREKSVYRGMELFLEYRSDHFPDAALYAPVLFDRRTTLDQYPDLLDREPQADDARTPVIEVINLLAGIPVPKRNSSSVHFLVRALHKSIVRKDVRKAVTFDLIDRVESRPFVLDGSPGDSAKPAFPGAGSPPLPVGRAKVPSIKAESTAQRVQPQILRHFTQFSGWSDDGLALLARTSPIHRAPAGTSLLTRGAVDHCSFYLLQGRVELRAEDGGRQIIDGGTPKAASPISSLRPRKYDVVALTPVTFLWIHDALLLAIIDGSLKARSEVEEIA